MAGSRGLSSDLAQGARPSMAPAAADAAGPPVQPASTTCTARSAEASAKAIERPTARGPGGERGVVLHGDGSTARQVFFLGVLDVLIGVVYWFAVVAVAARLRAVLARPKIRHRWELTTGWLFIAIGIGVAAAF
ncbi:hypothetical protein AB0K93_30525 [Streptomyces sp. NPDC052676]|uniref:hypothetical protein n=1 Tax=Streptomyces sp. NPDC052676 TaxID=3154953 RepID=UPI00343F3C89